jgi:hypothetical protein
MWNVEWGMRNVVPDDVFRSAIRNSKSAISLFPVDPGLQNQSGDRSPHSKELSAIRPAGSATAPFFKIRNPQFEIRNFFRLFQTISL